MALAGASVVRVPHISGYLAEPGGIYSPDGHCRAFDAAGAGTLFGSGVAAVVLKPLAAALADGDRVYASIKGSAVTNDGARKVNYTASAASAQARAMTRAMALADVTPDSIGYVECHGTATTIGDPLEIQALTRAFRTATARTQFCAIGSVKSNIGHLEQCAGFAGLIKAALTLHHGLIPPSLHYAEAKSADSVRIVAVLRQHPDTAVRQHRSTAPGRGQFGGHGRHQRLCRARRGAAAGGARPRRAAFFRRCPVGQNRNRARRASRQFPRGADFARCCRARRYVLYRQLRTPSFRPALLRRGRRSRRVGRSARPLCGRWAEPRRQKAGRDRVPVLGAGGSVSAHGGGALSRRAEFPACARSLLRLVRGRGDRAARRAVRRRRGPPDTHPLRPAGAVLGAGRAERAVAGLGRSARFGHRPQHRRVRGGGGGRGLFGRRGGPAGGGARPADGGSARARGNGLDRRRSRSAARSLARAWRPDRDRRRERARSHSGFGQSQGGRGTRRALPPARAAGDPAEDLARVSFAADGADARPRSPRSPPRSSSRRRKFGGSRP